MEKAIEKTVFDPDFSFENTTYKEFHDKLTINLEHVPKIDVCRTHFKGVHKLFSKGDLMKIASNLFMGYQILLQSRNEQVQNTQKCVLEMNDLLLQQDVLKHQLYVYRKSSTDAKAELEEMKEKEMILLWRLSKQGIFLCGKCGGILNGDFGVKQCYLCCKHFHVECFLNNKDTINDRFFCSDHCFDSYLRVPEKNIEFKSPILKDAVVAEEQALIDGSCYSLTAIDLQSVKEDPEGFPLPRFMEPYILDDPYPPIKLSSDGPPQEESVLLERMHKAEAAYCHSFGTLPGNDRSLTIEPPFKGVTISNILKEKPNNN